MPIVMNSRTQYLNSSSFGENTNFGIQKSGIFCENEVLAREFRRASSPLNNGLVNQHSCTMMPRPQIWMPRNSSGFKNSAITLNPTPIYFSNEVVCRSTPSIYNTNSLPRIDKRQNDRIVRIQQTQPTENVELTSAPSSTK